MENAPELLPGLDLYYNAFVALERERPVGMSAGHIPRRATQEYAEDYGLDDDQMELLHYAIVQMDDVITEWRSKQK